MAFFPLFVDLREKLCVVVGGGEVATRKIQALLDFGAKVKVISPAITAEIEALASSGRVVTVLREYQAGDCDNAFLMIAATSSVTTNETIYRTAVAHNIPVNVVDAPELCTFFFPALIKQQDLVIGINTAGKFPALARWLRQKINATLPPVYGELLETLGAIRTELMRLTNQNQRKCIINRLLEDVEQLKTAQELEQWRLHLDDKLKELLHE